MEFKFHPLGNLSQVEINLNKGILFGLGQARGTFKPVYGNVIFFPEKPEVTNGSVLLNARTLTFGSRKINRDSHNENWLNTKSYPKISFKIIRLKNFQWKKNILFAQAEGSLTIKEISQNIAIPVEIKYLRDQRRKYDGERGDIVLINGKVQFNMGGFGIIPPNMIDVIKENLLVKVTLIGCSDRCRSLLPSRLFP